MIGKKTRSFPLAAALSATLAFSGAFASSAIASRSVSVDDTGHLRLLKAFGSTLLEEGAAAGTLPGLAKVRLLVGSTVIASFTIQTKYGTIYGSGRAA